MCNVNIWKFFTWFLKENHQLCYISLQSYLSESSKLKNIIWSFLLECWKRFFQSSQKISDNSFENLQLQSLHHNKRHTIEEELEMKAQFSCLYKLSHQLQLHEYLQNLNFSQKWNYFYIKYYFWQIYFLWWQIRISILTDDCQNKQFYYESQIA